MECGTRHFLTGGDYDTRGEILFDLEGYLIVKNVLTKEEVDRLNAVSDENLCAITAIRAKTRGGEKAAGKRVAFPHGRPKRKR